MSDTWRLIERGVGGSGVVAVMAATCLGGKAPGFVTLRQEEGINWVRGWGDAFNNSESGKYGLCFQTKVEGHKWMEKLVVWACFCVEKEWWIFPPIAPGPLTCMGDVYCRGFKI
jgi:hypothetical protein